MEGTRLEKIEKAAVKAPQLYPSFLYSLLKRDVRSVIDEIETQWYSKNRNHELELAKTPDEWQLHQGTFVEERSSTMETDRTIMADNKKAVDSQHLVCYKSQTPSATYAKLIIYNKRAIVPKHTRRWPW